MQTQRRVPKGAIEIGNEYDAAVSARKESDLKLSDSEMREIYQQSPELASLPD
jgi:hypothetical protein